ncbi:MAG: phage/plasmid primase, P4 family [Planctomycetia bacterium]|nr:phage/plasmid primase, P4 family [Planctomycetia bacterium]
MDVKQQILSRIDFVAEYRNIGIQFDGTEPNAEGWVPCHAIDRDDHNASAAINVKNGFYTDLGGACRKLDFFDVMQLLGGFRSFKEVLEHFQEKFGIENAAGRPVKMPETEVDILPWNANGDRWCGLKLTNRTAVERAGGMLCRYQKRHTCVGFPVFASPDITRVSASGYVVAQTDGTDLPKYDRGGKIIGTAKYKIVAGTTSGLVGTEALLTIAKAREAGTLDNLTVIKVEGISDLTALLAKIPESKRLKILVLTNSGGTGEKPKKAWAEAFEGVDVAVVHDSDKPGQMGAENWCRYLHGLAKSVKNVVLPYAIAENHGKDLKDFLTENSFDDFLRLVQETECVKSEILKISEFAPDDPHRIATEYLKRCCKIENFEGIYTLVYQQGTWFQWKNGCYETLPAENLQASLTAFCHSLFLEDYQSEFTLWQSSQTTARPPLVRKVTNRLVSDVLNVLRSLVITDRTEDCYWRGDVTPEEFTSWKELIPVKNGIVHVGRLLAGRSDYLLDMTPMLFHRNVLPVEFDPGALSMAWCTMVEQNLQDSDGGWSKLNLFQDFLGYCLVPDTSLQKFLLCVGDGSNGKSAVLTGFFAMLGERNVANLSLEMFSDKFALAQLRGKLVNIVDDMSETDKICEGKLKSVVSGMSINSDRKNKDGINFKPLSRLIFCCNNPPKFQDKSNGIWRRLIMIPFKNSIPESQRDDRFCDVAFWEQEAAGIFNWCLAGLLRLRRNKNRFTECLENETEKRNYIYDANPVLLFFEEMLTVSDDGYIACSVLYKTYEDWCFRNGFRSLNASNFGREIARKFCVQKVRKWVSTQSREYVYVGIQPQPGAIMITTKKDF